MKEMRTGNFLNELIAIASEAGGLVTDFSGKRLRYNKESLLNGDFVVACSDELMRMAVEGK
jgi:3'-phosphoadenosine 5'-phosphosulfate (PAPS) 3'-phosphatase